MAEEKKIKTCDCKPGKTHIGVGGGVLILNDKNEFLMMRRGAQAKNEIGWWCKPGGALDFGESAIKAMKREIKEEIDVEIDIWGYLPHTDHVIKNEGQHWVAFNYCATIKKGEPRIMEPHKHDRLEWFAMDNLPKKTTKTT